MCCRKPLQVWTFFKRERAMRGMMLAVAMAFLAGSVLAGVGDCAIGN